MEKCTAQVISREEIAEGIHDLRLRLPETSRWQVLPGQFVGLYPENAARLLMRPISICSFQAAPLELRLVFRVAGGGTREFASAGTGDQIEILGPLGNGYDLEQLRGRKVVLLGGGIGIPPMLGLAQALAEAGTPAAAVLGYRDGSLFLKEEFEKVCTEVLIATEDGSAGTRGNVLDALRARGEVKTGEENTAAALCACGPLPMLRAVKRYAAERGLPCWLSLEERMACGVGACLGCVVRTRETDAHSHVRNARICTEGPVFPAEEVEI